MRAGDTLSQIAASHGTTVQQLLRLNNLKSARILAGQKLRVRAAPPARASTAPAAPRPATAVVSVKRGDTLWEIATRHGTTVDHLRRVNGLKTNVLYVGQTLRLSAPAPVRRGPSVRLERGLLLGVPAAVVRVDLSDPSVLVTPVLPLRGLGTGVNLKSLAQRAGATMLINGGYFHPRSFIPAGDLVVRGRFISTGRVPTAVAITPDNRVYIRPVQSVSFASWRGFETVIASGPHVLRGGQVAGSYANKYRDRAIFGRAARSALGINGERQLLFMTTKAQLTPSEVAKMMRRAGARDAILLDGGSSTGLAWKGKVLYQPSRHIAYGIGVYANYPGKRLGR